MKTTKNYNQFLNEDNPYDYINSQPSETEPTENDNKFNELMIRAEILTGIEDFDDEQDAIEALRNLNTQESANLIDSIEQISNLLDTLE